MANATNLDTLITSTANNGDLIMHQVAVSDISKLHIVSSSAC